MSVAVPVIDHVDPDLRRIYLKAGVREIHMLDDIYYEMRNLRRTDESLRGWYSFCEAGGNVQKTATTYTPRYLTMLTDPRPVTTKIVPAGTASTVDVAHTLVIKGEVISDQGTSKAAVFDKSELTVSVDLEFEPPGAEIIRLDQALIEYASFGGAVHVDVASVYSGTGYASDGVPVGSPLAPVNNWEDAHTISEARGLPTFMIYTSTTIVDTDFVGPVPHTFKGASPYVVVTVADAADVSGCDFTNMTLIGQLDGINVVRDCSIGPITAVSGIFEKCAFWASVDLIGDTSMFDCFSQVVGGGSATVNAYEWDLIVRGFKGSLTLANTAVGHLSSIGVCEGKQILDPTVTEGEIHLRGIPFDIVDNSSGNAVIFDETGSSTMVYAVHQGLTRSVFLDPDSLSNGDGSQAAPFNNVGDALDYLELNNITQITLMSDVILDRNLKNVTVTGIGVPEFDANGQDLKGSKIVECQFKGNFTDQVLLRDCNILAGGYLNGYAENCAFSGDVTLNGPTHIIRGYSQLPGAGYMSINTNGFILQVSDWHRSLGIVGMTAGTHTIEMYGGRLHVDATSVGGTINLRGAYSTPPNDQSNGTILVDETTTSHTYPLTFTKANELDVNVKSQNDATVHGTGINTDKWRGTL